MDEKNEPETLVIEFTGITEEQIARARESTARLREKLKKLGVENGGRIEDKSMTATN